MASLPQTYKAAVLPGPNEGFELRDLPMKQPGEGEVLVRVLACGVCGTDGLQSKGGLGNPWPRVPGHELVGDVVAVGEGVTRFQAGDRVGGPWHGGSDMTCRSCQRGTFQCCDNVKYTGVHADGGYAEYTVLRSEATVRVPKDADPAKTAPLLCAGVTVFNGMRKMKVETGNLVAVQGLGGLGHLAVQMANKMGYRVVALSSGDSKRDFAHKLGAHHYINTKTQDPAEALQAMGGAALIVATAPNSAAISPLVGGCQTDGKLLLLSPVGDIPFNSAHMILRNVSVHGWCAGHSLDCEECVDFATTHGIECMIEKFPLSDVKPAFEAMSSGSVRFRAVLAM